MKITSNLNKNFNTTKKHPTFGVRKTDTIQSFINEIRITNPNLGNIARLPIVQKMKENDTFEQLQEKANADKSMFENKRSFNIANKKGFTYLINSICIKIMQELEQLEKAVGKFIVQVEDENGNKKENDIVFAFKNKKYVKEYRQNNSKKWKKYQKKYQKEYYKDHKDERKEYNKEYRQNNLEDIKTEKKNYYETHKDTIREKQRNYYETHKDEINKKRKHVYKLKNQEKKVIMFLSELIHQKNEKN